MTMLTVGRIQAHSVAENPAVGRDLADRLAALIAAAARTVDDELAGLADQELVLIRRLDVAVALDRTSTDDSAATAWARTIGRTIAGIVDSRSRDPGSVARGASPHLEVVRYGDSTDALADLVASLSVGDLTRAWAWAMAGLTEADGAPGTNGSDPAASGRHVLPRSDARRAALDALSQRLDEAAAALVSAAGVAGLPAVHRLLGDEGWRELAGLLLTHLGNGGSPTSLLREARQDWVAGGPPAWTTAGTDAPAESLATRFADVADRSGLAVQA
jgi:hypothetical protein